MELHVLWLRAEERKKEEREGRRGGERRAAASCEQFSLISLGKNYTPALEKNRAKILKEDGKQNLRRVPLETQR